MKKYSYPSLLSRSSGYLLGLLSASTFGMIPLFTLPLMASGIPAQTALVYRFGGASIILGLALWLKGENFALPSAALLKLALLSFFYMLDVILLFYAFSFVSSGVAATLEFLCPVTVILIMTLFYGEKFSPRAGLATGLALAGVALLSASPDIDPALDATAARLPAPPFGSPRLWGVLLALFSGFANALYLVGLQVARLPKMSDLLLTFYIMAFGSFFCFLNAGATSSLVWIADLRGVCMGFGLALVTAVISNATLIMAIRRIGSTIASILGVMEPLTAVVVGMAIFGEACSSRIICGITIALAAAVIVVLVPEKNSRSARRSGQSA
ncbi:MAG: DMT family transporter [Desulfovibrio sp.]|nr:DMT family transporter [Desulfovibrio sp.]